MKRYLVILVVCLLHSSMSIYSQSLKSDTCFTKNQVEKIAYKLALGEECNVLLDLQEQEIMALDSVVINSKALLQSNEEILRLEREKSLNCSKMLKKEQRWKVFYIITTGIGIGIAILK